MTHKNAKTGTMRSDDIIVVADERSWRAKQSARHSGDDGWLTLALTFIVTAVLVILTNNGF